MVISYIGRVWLKNQQENIPSNNTFHFEPFCLRYPRQPWLNKEELPTAGAILNCCEITRGCKCLGMVFLSIILVFMAVYK